MKGRKGDGNSDGLGRQHRAAAEGVVDVLLLAAEERGEIIGEGLQPLVDFPDLAEERQVGVENVDLAQLGVGCAQAVVGRQEARDVAAGRGALETANADPAVVVVGRVLPGVVGEADAGCRLGEGQGFADRD